MVFRRSQYGCRASHSTGAALLRVLNSVYSSIDKKLLTVLVGLVISAAFDTVSHKILLERLNYMFGISDKILDGLSSYLDNRSQNNQLGRHRSPPILQLSKASESAKLFLTGCVTSSMTQTHHHSAAVNKLASSCSAYIFQTHCHRKQWSENISAIISWQSAKCSVHIIVNVTMVIKSTVGWNLSL